MDLYVSLVQLCLQRSSSAVDVFSAVRLIWIRAMHDIAIAVLAFVCGTRMDIVLQL